MTPTRRHLKRALLGAVSFLPLLLSASITPVDVRWEGKVNPLAAPATPELSWRLEAADAPRAQIQRAWQVLVASSPEKLQRNVGDLWDSGKQPAGRSPKEDRGNLLKN